MTADALARWKRVKGIYDEVADVSSATRQTLIDERCGQDPEMRAEVNRLLSRREQEGLALDVPYVNAGALGYRTGPRYHPGELVAGRYRIAALLGAGGMGEVYSALDTAQGDQRVAVKALRLDRGSAELDARFRREVRLAQQVDHPHVCRVFELGEHAGDLFCVMELLEGETLFGRLARVGRLSPAEALPIALQLCQGLAAAHRAGVIHRDLKPANIILLGTAEDPRAVIIDFGLAAGFVHDQALTQDGAVIGTLAYMAPEQMEAGGSTAVADLYSLGVVFFEMLTGQKLHNAKSPLRLAVQKAREGFRPPVFAAGGVPLVWREVIAGCLQAQPAKRTKSAQGAHDRLQLGRPSLGFVLSRPLVRLPLTILLLLVLSAYGWGWWRSDPAPDPEAATLYSQAMAALVEASPVRAIGLLERSLNRDPQFLSARALIAIAHTEVDQLDKAQNALLQATAASDGRWRRGHSESLRLDAARAVLMHDFDGAANRYRILSDQVSPRERSQIHVLRARMLEQAGKSDEALTVLGQVVKVDPGNLTARVRYATLLARQHHLDAAKEHFTFAEEAYKGNDNREGLAGLLLARADSLHIDPAADRRDLERALEFSGGTRNPQHRLTAQFRLAMLDVQDRAYEKGINGTRQAAARAQREGLHGVAAAAMGDLGYALFSARRWDEAVIALRESVAMAEEARSYAILAANRIRLGEALSNPQFRRVAEAIEVMGPAITWYRQNHYNEVLPVALLKWGTVLVNAARPDAAEASFREALDRAKAQDSVLRQTMALQRLGGFFNYRDLRQAVAYWDDAVPQARRSGLTLVFIQAAGTHNHLGEYGSAANLQAEFDRRVLKFEPGSDRSMLENRSRHVQWEILYFQGKCLVYPLTDLIARSKSDACRPGVSDATVRGHLQWLEKTAEEATAKGDILEATKHWEAASHMALRLADFPNAVRLAERTIGLAHSMRFSELELEASLVLRAAQHRSGNREAVSQLTRQCLDLATRIGFRSPADQFGGRQDLRRLWLKVPVRHE